MGPTLLVRLMNSNYILLPTDSLSSSSFLSSSNSSFADRESIAKKENFRPKPHFRTWNYCEYRVGDWGGGTKVQNERDRRLQNVPKSLKCLETPLAAAERLTHTSARHNVHLHFISDKPNTAQSQPITTSRHHYYQLLFNISRNMDPKSTCMHSLASRFISATVYVW